MKSNEQNQPDDMQNTESFMTTPSEAAVIAALAQLAGLKYEAAHLSNEVGEIADNDPAFREWLTEKSKDHFTGKDRGNLPLHLAKINESKGEETWSVYRYEPKALSLYLVSCKAKTEGKPALTIVMTREEYERTRNGNPDTAHHTATEAKLNAMKHKPAPVLPSTPLPAHNQPIGSN